MDKYISLHKLLRCHTSAIVVTTILASGKFSHTHWPTLRLHTWRSGCCPGFLSSAGYRPGMPDRYDTLIFRPKNPRVAHRLGMLTDIRISG